MALNALCRASRSSYVECANSRKLRELATRDDITNTFQLVNAYNKARDPVERRVLRSWLRKYVSWFSEQTNENLTAGIIESYMRLADIFYRGPKDAELLMRFFSSLTARLNEQAYCTYDAIMALEHTLNVIDPKLLEDRAADLLQLVPLLVTHLDPTKNRYTKMMYTKHGVTLFALHQTLVVLQTVAPGQLTEQVLNTVMNIMNEMEKSDAYYPYVFYAILVKHSIKNLMQKNALGNWMMFSRRMFYGLCGSLCMLQGLRAIARLEYDISAIERGLRYFDKAFNHLQRDKWTQELQSLFEAGLKSLETDDFSYFEAQQAQSMNAGRKSFSKDKNTRMLRFCIISQLRMLTVEGRSDTLCSRAMNQLIELTESSSTSEWFQDPHIFEAMLDALHAIYIKGEQAEKARKMLDALIFGTQDEKLHVKVRSWMGNNKDLDDLLRSSVDEDDYIEGDNLFEVVREEMGLGLTWRDLKDNLDGLQEFYTSTSFATVPSIFDERTLKHVKDFEYDIVGYEEIPMPMLASNNNFGDHLVEYTESKERVRVKVTLEDILKSRTFGYGKNPTTKDRKYLLLGNPGTGKTSISKSFAYGWATGLMGQEFNTVYVLRVRDLTDGFFDGGYKKEKTLSTAIANNCFRSNEDMDEKYVALKKQISDELERATTLLILDGLDEGDDTGDVMVNEALEHNCYVLFTSRPYNVTNVRPHIGNELECLGLSDEQLTRFIEREVPNDAQKLLNHIKDIPAVWEMAQVPITASILCFLWSDKEERYTIEDVIGKSRFKMYQRMVHFIWQRYLQRRKKGSPILNRSNVFNSLEKIAFHARNKGEILISEELVLEYSPDGDDGSVFRDSGFFLFQLEGKQYQFLHLSFQEYFVGRLLASSLFQSSSNRALEFIAKNKYKQVHWDTFSFMTQAATSQIGDEAIHQVLSVMDREPCDVLRVQHTFLKLRMVEAFLSIKEEPIEESAHYTSCKEVVDATSNLFDLLGDKGKEKHLDMIVDQTEKSVNLVKSFSDLLHPIIEQIRNDLTQPHWGKVRCLARLGHLSPKVLQSLKDILEQLYTDGGVECRRGVIGCLGCVNGVSSKIPDFVIDLLGKGFCDVNVDSRIVATNMAQELITRRLNQTPQIWQMLKNACFDSEPDVRASSIRQFAQCALSSTDLGVTAWNLITETTNNENESNILRKLLHDEHKRVRMYSLEAILFFARIVKGEAMDIQRELKDGCADVNTHIREFLIFQIGVFAHYGEENVAVALPLLENGLQDPDSEVRIQAARQISELARAGLIDESDTMELLMARFREDDNRFVRIEAMKGIAGFITEATEDNDDPMKILINACDDREFVVRKHACDFMAAVCKEVPTMAEMILKKLKTKCEDEDDRVRGKAIKHFLELSHLVDCDDTPAVLALVRTDSVQEIREQATYLSRRVTMTEDQRREADFKSLSEKLDAEALNEMLKIDDAARHFGEVMINAVSRTHDDRDDRIRDGRIKVLKAVVEYIRKSRGTPDYVNEATRLLITLATGPQGWEKDEALELIQVMPMKCFFDVYWMTRDELIIPAVADRLLNAAVTVSSIRGGEQYKLVIHEAAEEFQFRGSPETVQHLESIMKSTVPGTMSPKQDDKKTKTRRRYMRFLCRCFYGSLDHEKS